MKKSTIITIGSSLISGLICGTTSYFIGLKKKKTEPAGVLNIVKYKDKPGSPEVFLHLPNADIFESAKDNDDIILSAHIIIKDHAPQSFDA